MVEPQRAFVKPRIVHPDDGEKPLLDEIQRHIEKGTHGVIALLGPHGAGKTVALQHLTATLPVKANVLLIDSDEAKYADLPTWGNDWLVIYAARAPQSIRHVAAYHLATWGHDDLIEYMLARHKKACANVMERVHADESDIFAGVPELWAVILDQLAADESIPDVRSALRQFLEQQLPDTDVVQRSRNACLNLLTAPKELKEQHPLLFSPPGFTPSLARVLRHPAIQYLLAAERIVADLNDDSGCDYLACRLPRELVRAVGRQQPASNRAIEKLQAFVAGPAWGQAMAASLLHALAATWKPESLTESRLAGAYLDRVDWQNIDLSYAKLLEADLSGANLASANLKGAFAEDVQMGRCQLRQANLHEFIASHGNFVGADFSHAGGWNAHFDAANMSGAKFADAILPRAIFAQTNLTSASFTGAILESADFSGAELCDADFTKADLSGAQLSCSRLQNVRLWNACLHGAKLTVCDLEYVDFGQADLRAANLRGALLTGTTMTHADLEGACLRHAGLGDINWEHCCLCEADLSGATFHMGSTRSGLVFSTIASEGSRTGFYTDDYDDRSFKEPEEIRKANLCGCDLRGAYIGKVDFYLVDLRGALYDEEQEDHFRRCGAILGPWV
jgi:uncharacterized protein YjbI with pentapeptide repeats